MEAKKFRAKIDVDFLATGLDDAFRRLALHFAALASGGDLEADKTYEAAEMRGGLGVTAIDGDESDVELEPILPEAIDAEVKRVPPPDTYPAATPRIVTGTYLSADDVNALGLLGWLLPGDYDVTGEIDGETIVLRLAPVGQ